MRRSVCGQSKNRGFPVGVTTLCIALYLNPLEAFLHAGTGVHSDIRLCTRLSSHPCASTGTISIRSCRKPVDIDRRRGRRQRYGDKSWRLGMALSTPSPLDMQGQYRLMLVDDEEPLRRAVSDYLKQQGYDVAAYESATDALADLNAPLSSRPDLIITDIMMPDMDGYQFLMELRGSPFLRWIPVIFLTASGLTRDRIKGYRAGVNAYIPKPFDPEELVSIVDNLIVNSLASSTRNIGAGQGMEELRRELGDIKLMLESGSAVGGKKRLKSANVPEPLALMSPVENDDEAIVPYVSLTPKESQVLTLLVQGYTNREIATQEQMSVRSVEKHVSHMLAKTDTTNRTELVRYCLKMGLLIHRDNEPESGL
ncbi:unnamed protein product [Choristocarpus tenellus]